jgi:molybdopterin converting factor small subunit
VKVYVKLYADLVHRIREAVAASKNETIKAGVPLETELTEKSTVVDLLAHLNLEKKDAVIVFINGRARTPDHELAAGDHVGIFPPIGGG